MKIFTAIAIAGLVPAALAQTAQKRGDPPPASNTVVVSKGQTIQSAVAGMAKAAGVLAAVDPNLNGRVSEATSKLALERGLDVIAQENHAIWRKVYLADKEIPRLADGTVDARALKRLVSNVSEPVTANIGVVNPSSGLLTVVTRAPEKSPDMAEWIKSRKPVYLLYVPGPVQASGPAGDMMPPGGIEAFNAMTPQQRAQWMKDHGGVIVTSDMSPEERAQALQNLPPDERARIEDKMSQAGQNGAKSVMIFRQDSKQ